MHEAKSDRREGEDGMLASQIAAPYFARDVKIQASLLGGGDCNENYLVASSDKKIVVKLSKPEREAQAFEGYRKERWCIDEVSKRGVRTPDVREVGESRGRAYLIQSFLEGVPVADLHGVSTLDEQEVRRVWETLGRYARQIHAIPVTGYGETMTKEGVFTGSWQKHLQYNIDCLDSDDVLIQRGVVTPELSVRIRAAFQVLAEKRFDFGLSHADLALRNAIVAPSGEVFLLDWDTARAEIVPHYDFNELLRDSKPSQEQFDAFLQGYGMTREAYQEMEEEMLVLNLLRSIDTLRWAIDKAPEVTPQHVQQVHAALDRLGWT